MSTKIIALTDVIVGDIDLCSERNFPLLNEYCQLHHCNKCCFFRNNPVLRDVLNEYKDTNFDPIT